MRLLILSALFAAAAVGQNSNVLYFAHAESMQDVKEIATALRTLVQLQDVPFDDAKKSVTLHGTADQIAAAQWLFNELDQSGHTDVRRQFRIGKDETLTVMYLPYTPSVKDFQEAVTAMRTIADVRFVFTVNSSRAMAMRGSADQIALVDWLVKEFGKPEHAQPVALSQSSASYEVPDGSIRPEKVVRVFYLANAATIGDFQEAAVVVRTTAEIRRVFTYNGPRAIVVRGNAGQVALAEWLVRQLDKPASPPAQVEAAYSYLGDGSTNDLVRVFYLPHTGSIAEFQNIGTEIRKTTGLRRVYTYNAPRALTLRGSADQLAMAERLMSKMDEADAPK